VPVAVGRQRTEREAVKGVLGREDALASGRRTSELERCFDGLGAGAREQDSLETVGCPPQELLG
jgi:hypothetical protein